MCIISISLSPFMTQFLNLLLGQTKSICFRDCWQYFLTIFLPHWWHWVKSLLIVETIYLLNFVGWARVALVPTKWQIFNSNKLQIVLLWRTRAVLLSPVKWNTWRAYVAKPIYPQITVLEECFISNREDQKMNFKNLFQNGTNAHKLQLKRSLEMDWNYVQG